MKSGFFFEIMYVSIKNTRFYYAVQVYLDEKWQTVETFKSEGEAKRFRDKLQNEADGLTLKEIYKKFIIQ